LQAGREIRVIVQEDILDDEKAALLAHDLAKRIEAENGFPRRNLKLTLFVKSALFKQRAKCGILERVSL